MNIVLDYKIHIHGKRLFHAIAPTKKACKRLSQVANEHGVPLTVSTISSYLGQLPKLDPKTGKQLFETDKNRINDNDIPPHVLIVDEYGMIGKDNLKLLLNKADREGSNLLFLGDTGQLPPVGEKESSLISQLKERYKYYHQIDLITPKRYAGDITAIVNSYHCKLSDRAIPFHDTPDGTIKTYSRYGNWIEAYQKLVLEHGCDNVKAFHFKNATVDENNDYVWECIYPNADLLVANKGEKLISLEPLMRVGSKNKWEIYQDNSEEFTVLENIRFIDAKWHRFNNDEWRYWEVLVLNESSERLKLFYIPRNSEDYQIYISALAAAKQIGLTRKDWKYYYDLKNTFDSVRSSLNLTVHKGQGSGYDYVFVNCRDMMKTEMSKQLIYTACTRTQKQLHVLV